MDLRECSSKTLAAGTRTASKHEKIRQGSAAKKANLEASLMSGVEWALPASRE